MNAPDDIDMLAAEYVLGTLDRDERSSVERRRVEEPDLEAAIAAWERRLAPLDERTPVATPDQSVRNAARAKIAQLPAAGQAEGESARSDIVFLQRRATRWRATALAAMAAAATFAGLFFFGEHLRPFNDRTYVAVFNEGDTQPAFVMSIDLATRELTVRPIAADRLTDKTYELWIVSDDISLRSLGLLSSVEQPTRKRLDAFDSKALQQATFGISIEPTGGSPVGRPTGPALHGKLIPARD